MAKYSFDLKDIDRDSGLTIEDALLIPSTSAFTAGSDYNGDGIDDLIVSPTAESLTQVQIIYGSDKLPAKLDLEKLDKTTRIDGDPDSSNSVKLASDPDFDGDGIDDLIYITAKGATFDEIDFVGSLILGSKDLATTIDLSDLDGDNGLGSLGDFAPIYAQGVNINGDDIDDLLLVVGDLESQSLAPNQVNYVFLGSDRGFDSSLDPKALNGRNGFKIETGPASLSYGAAQDINGDGFNDLAMDFISLSSGKNTASILFGGKTFPSAINPDNFDGDDGFTIVSSNTNENAYISAFFAGDINGDDIGDLYVDRKTVEGLETFAVFGNETFDATLDLSDLDGDNGFSIINSDNDESNMFISGTADFNNDGLSDLVVKDVFTSPTYVIFGQSEFEAEIDLADLDGDNGFMLAETDAFNYAAPLTGDFNGDGANDLILQTGIDSNLTYVVFDTEGDFGAEFDPTKNTNSLVISAQSSDLIIKDIIDLNGDGADDLVYEPVYNENDLSLLQIDRETGIPDIQIVYGDADLGTA